MVDQSNGESCPVSFRISTQLDSPWFHQARTSARFPSAGGLLVESSAVQGHAVLGSFVKPRGVTQNDPSGTRNSLGADSPRFWTCCWRASACVMMMDCKVFQSYCDAPSYFGRVGAQCNPRARVSTLGGFTVHMALEEGQPASWQTIFWAISAGHLVPW